MALSLKKTASDSAAPKLPKGAKSLKPTKPRKQQFILFVGDEGAILVYMEGATVVRRLFAPTATEEHTHAMTELMQQHPKAPVSMIFDVIDQQYVRQTFPPVSALSVEGLVKRRLDRDFPPEDLVGSLRIGREDTARKDWAYLLISLANTANFQQWLDLVVEQPNYFSGVYLLPVECQQIIPLLAAVMPERPQTNMIWHMLISHHKVGGFRIVVLRDGKLAFTRVTQAVGEAVSSVIAGNIEQEIQNTIEYIRRLGYSEVQGLEVFAILSGEVRDAIDATRISAAAINLLSPIDVAEALDLKQAALAADRFGDVVMASSFALIRKPVLRLYPAYAKKLDQLVKARLAVKAGGVLLGLAFLGLGVSTVLDGVSAQGHVRDAEQAIRNEEATLQNLKTQSDKLGEKSILKSDVANFYSTLLPEEYSPLSGIKDLASLRTPDVNVDEWEWSWASTLTQDGSGGLQLGANASQAPQQASSPQGTGPAGPITVRVKATLLGNFPDNETLIVRVNQYKAHIENALTDYVAVINNQEFNSASNSGKVSVALSEDASGAQAGGDEKATILDITVTGPKPKVAEAGAQPQPEGGL